MRHVITILAASSSVAFVASGAYLACIAQRYPAKSLWIEYLAGSLLIGGLSLLGACLQWFVL
jgi:hypothetical protein